MASRSTLICGIHQPNFLPWLGYFDKIRRADVFVFLDDVAYPKSGSGMGSWCNRVRIRIQGEPRFVGCPVFRVHGMQRIREVRIDDQQPWRRKLLRTLAMNYKRAPGYAGAMALLEPLIHLETDRLAEFNIGAIRSLCEALGLCCRLVRQSDLNVGGRATELLINLVRACGCGVYLSGGGARGYQDDRVFPENDVELIYQRFRAIPYASDRSYYPGLSVIDYLMRVHPRDWRRTWWSSDLTC